MFRLAPVCAALGAVWCGSANASPAGSAWSADLPVVSDGRHLWTWAPSVAPNNGEEPRVSLFHADLAQRPPEGPAWESVVQLTGRLAARGVAADNHTLYLIFEDGSTDIVSLEAGPVEGHWFFSPRPAPRLPVGAAVRAVAAGGGKLWVLVRVESAETLNQIDASTAPDDRPRSALDDDNRELFDLILGYPDGDPALPDTAGDSSSATPETGRDTADQDETVVPAPEAESQSEVEAEVGDSQAVATESAVSETPEPEAEVPAVDLPTERLLVLERGVWSNSPLPEAWPIKLPTQLVASGVAGERPTLVVQVPSTTGRTGVRVYRPTEGGWASTDLPVAPHANGESASTPDASGGSVALRVGEQLVLVQGTPGSDGFAADVYAVRGDQLLPVANHAPAAEGEGAVRTGQWAAVPAEGGVALLAGARGLGGRLDAQRERFDPATQDTGPVLSVVDLHGQTVLPAEVLTFKPADPIAEAADMVIFLGVLVTSTVLLFTFWRRVPTADALHLPADVVLADNLRRALAGLIDLTPGLLVGTLAFGLGAEELYERWPGRGRGMTFEMMVPGLAAIGVIVGHTALLEIAAGGRSLGKLLTGLRVTTLEGRPPRPWQSLVRCLLKTFDLIAYLLLILPIISPHRQRLGDMVARTVVTMSAPPNQDPESKDRA